MSALTIIAQLAWVVAAVVLAVAVFLGLCAIAACLWSSRISRAEEATDLAIAQRLSATEPTAPMIAYVAPPIAPAPVLFTNKPFVLGNPLTNKRISPEVRQ